jgi:uncharacterized metal-binding protein YceD (DUF177 family)
MENNFINLNEGSFPIKIKKSLKKLTNLDQLGEIREDIKVNLEIERMSEFLFFTKGIILVTFESECQRCFKNTDINLNLEIKVSIKDKKYQNIDKKGPIEVHYQDVHNFDIDTLIAEEIHLNYPSIVDCCSTDNNDEISDQDLKKIKPFKKIRDLIK